MPIAGLLPGRDQQVPGLLYCPYAVGVRSHAQDIDMAAWTSMSAPPGLRFLIRDRAGQFTEAFRLGAGRCRDRGGEDPAPEPSGERSCRTFCAHRPDGGDRADADLRRTTPARRDDGVRGPLQRTTTPSQPGTPPAPARSLSPTSPGSGSSVGPFSAASSTNTSGPRRSPGQDRWPSSGTPQGVSWLAPFQTSPHSERSSGRRGVPELAQN